MSITQTTAKKPLVEEFVTLMCFPGPSQENMNLNKRLNHLTAILTKHEQWEDPLSQRLFKWGTKILSSIQSPKKGEEWEIEVLQMVQKRVDKLFSILSNPLDEDRTLENPVLERDWPWEEAMLNEYQTLKTSLELPELSPFDGELMTKSRPHTFAKEMLVWSKSISQINKESIDLKFEDLDVSDLSVTKKLYEKPIARAKLLLYTISAKAYAKAQKLREIRYIIKDHSNSSAELFKEARKLVKQEAARFTLELKERDQKLDVRINSIDQTHTQTVNILNGRIDDAQDKILEVEAELEEGKIQYKALDMNYNSLLAQFRAKCNEVANMKPKKGGKCSIM